MLNFFLDIISYIKFKFVEKNYTTGFFCENIFIYNYLEPYILNKIKKKKLLIISFEPIENKNKNKISIFIFRNNFIRELVFLTLNLKYLYSSTPDLENSLFKKSKFSKCKYIYLQHSPVSLNLIYRENAFDAFDALQTISKYQSSEFKEIKNIRSLKTRNFKSKYLFTEAAKKKLSNNLNIEFEVLIAPSWNTNFYKLNCHKTLHQLLTKKNISYKLRPHPMSFKKKEITMDDLNLININLDTNKNINFNCFKYLISDWSGIFIEYSLIHLKKSYLINTPKKDKVMKYEKFQNVPVEIRLREVFSYTFEVDQLDELLNKINSYNINQNLNNKDENLIDIINNEFY